MAALCVDAEQQGLLLVEGSGVLCFSMNAGWWGKSSPVQKSSQAGSGTWLRF